MVSQNDRASYLQSQRNSNDGASAHFDRSSIMSKGLPKRRIKKNFIKDKLLVEDKMAKLSKGDKIRYASERELF